MDINILKIYPKNLVTRVVIMYSKILNDISKTLPQQHRWWPKFFYHFTDVHNAVSILKTGWLYSRGKAVENHLMATDNASRMVINLTNSGVEQLARLYFRPKTPTQYHNEGYKPTEIRDKNIDACCPFSSNTTLN